MERDLNTMVADCLQMPQHALFFVFKRGDCVIVYVSAAPNQFSAKMRVFAHLAMLPMMLLLKGSDRWDWRASMGP